MRAYRTLLLSAALLAACGKETPPAAAASALPPDLLAFDAGRLGSQVLHVLDQSAEYTGSRRGRHPRSLRDLGMDSLTPEFARVLSMASGEPVATVSFRRLEGHALASCSGGAELLESAALAGGTYTLTCVTTDGQTREVEAGGTSE